MFQRKSSRIMQRIRRAPLAVWIIGGGIILAVTAAAVCTAVLSDRTILTILFGA